MRKQARCFSFAPTRRRVYFQPNRFAKVRDLGGRFIGGASMCDYSLHAVATRPAEVAETLVSTNFSTGTHGFASPDDPKVAVCLRPGTEIAFENDVQTDGRMFRKHVGVRLARFRQIHLNKPYQHHDALEFSNAQSCLSLTSLRGRGLPYCNCLQAQSRKSLRRPNLPLGMRPPTSDGQKRLGGVAHRGLPIWNPVRSRARGKSSKRSVLISEF